VIDTVNKDVTKAQQRGRTSAGDVVKNASPKILFNPPNPLHPRSKKIKMMVVFKSETS
jgi:hypothetical protein